MDVCFCEFDDEDEIILCICSDSLMGVVFCKVRCVLIC